MEDREVEESRRSGFVKEKPPYGTEHVLAEIKRNPPGE